jgi:hypothetical protein
VDVKTHKEEFIMPYLIGSSHPVFSPDGKYIYLISAANDILTFSPFWDVSQKKREVKTVPVGMYRVDITTSEIKLITLMTAKISTASTVVITSDGKILYYNDDHAVYGMNLETGAIFLLCGSRDTFGDTNGKGEYAR